MKAINHVTKSIQLLNFMQRIKLGIFLALQILNSMLDIFGVILVGILVLQSQNGEISNSSNGSTSLDWALPSNIFGFSQSQSLLLLLALSLFFFSLKAMAAPFIQKKLLIFLGGIAANFSRNLMFRLFSRDIIFNHRRTTQEIAFLATTGSFQTFQGVLGNFALSLSELIIMIGVFTLFSVINIYLTIFVIFFFSSTLLLLNRKLKKVIKENNRTLNDAEIKSRMTIQEALNSYREVFVSQKINSLIRTLVSDLQNSINARASLTWANLIPKYILDTSLIVGIAIIGGFSYALYSPEEALTIVGLFVLGSSRILPSLLRFNTGIQGVQNSSDASNRLQNLLRELADSESDDAENKILLTPFANADCVIGVNSLHFNYKNARETLLDDLSFCVKKGEFLAVVGPSGSGKSTLVDLLIGVIEDPSKSIRIGEASPRDQVRLKPGLIGYVPQNVSLFSQSLIENIALGVPQIEINQANIDRAIERASLSELVKSLPLGLKTLVGENGHNFSGGQKQRIGLARAFYSNPEILVLDEATSALDAETEYEISQMLSSLAGDLTLIVVAHRLTTVQKADRVLYLGGAGFSAMGTFEELRVNVPNFDTQAKLLGL